MPHQLQPPRRAPWLVMPFGQLAVRQSLLTSTLPTSSIVTVLPKGALSECCDNIFLKFFTPDAAKVFRADNPQGRFVQVDEVAGTALWLCSDAARSINGHALSLSGGEI